MLIFSLEYNGQMVAHVQESDIGDEISIGRDPSCRLVAAPTDKVMSARHAIIRRKGKNFYLVDNGSRNGIFKLGKKIESCKLVPGDHLTVGEAVLAVENDTNIEVQKQPHKIAITSGPNRGSKVVIGEETIRIGSEPGSQVLLLDPLISRHHAEICRKADGGCWIRDLDSKNGTFINGEKLQPKAERLLREGDRICIAQFEMRFEDGAYEHKESRVWLKLIVILFTFGIAFGARQMLVQLKPEAEQYLSNARQLAAEENFAGARLLAQDIFTAKGGEKLVPAATELLRQIEIWEKTAELWQSACQDLEAGRWTSAARAFATVQIGGAEIWGWNEKSLRLRGQAMGMKTILDDILKAQSLLSNENCDFNELQQLGLRMQDLNALPANTPWGKSLGKRAAECLTQIQDLQKANRELTQCLTSLNQAEPDLPGIVKQMETLRQHPMPQIRRQADSALEPLRILAAANASLLKMRQLIADANFSNAESLPFILPGLEMCSIDENISACRKRLDSVYREQKDMLNQVRYFYGQYLENTGSLTEDSPALTLLTDPKKLEKAMNCDVLNGPLPKHTRQTPSGEYDRLLGFEEFYQFMALLPERGDEMAPSGLELPFRSAATIVGRELAAGIRLQNYLQTTPFRTILEKGKIGEAVRKVTATLKRRDQLIEHLLKQAETANGRTALLAAALAERIRPTDRTITFQGKELAVWIASTHKSLRNQIQDIMNEYEKSGPTVQIELREKVLATGVPGDANVRRMWVVREASR